MLIYTIWKAILHLPSFPHKIILSIKNKDFVQNTSNLLKLTVSYCKVICLLETFFILANALVCFVTEFMLFIVLTSLTTFLSTKYFHVKYYYR
jgi:hypothetical protein